MPSPSVVLPPRWLTAKQLPTSPDAALRHWLFHDSSLTAALRQQSQQDIRVDVIKQGWQRLRNDECSALGIAANSVGWVREVQLVGDGEPWVFARSVSASRHTVLILARLGARSLGEVLFGKQAYSRSPLQACRYPRAWLPAPWQQEELWARRSKFQRGAEQLLVTEVFLPDFLARLPQN